jgi:type II secretory pathway component GspD/PulD (secretin)
MHNTAFAVFLFATAALLVAETAYAQQPIQPVPNLPPHAAPQVQPQPQPEVAAREPVIEVKDGKLSVDLADAEIGSVISEIAHKLNFQVEINSTVYNKKVTTRFCDLDVEQGIRRLLTLAKENNYLFRYDTAGKLSKVELYAETPSPLMRQPALPPQPLPFSTRRFQRYVPPQPVPTSPGQPQPVTPTPRALPRQ